MRQQVLADGWQIYFQLDELGRKQKPGDRAATCCLRQSVAKIGRQHPFTGRAQLLDDHTVAVDGKEYSAERTIATGGWPFVPDVPGKQHIVTSNDMFFLDQLPKQIIIVGGGYIAVEFASILHGLGVNTTICHRGTQTA